jgi:hypothetical protein
MLDPGVSSVMDGRTSGWFVTTPVDALLSIILFGRCGGG